MDEQVDLLIQPNPPIFNNLQQNSLVKFCILYIYLYIEIGLFAVFGSVILTFPDICDPVITWALTIICIIYYIINICYMLLLLNNHGPIHKVWCYFWPGSFIPYLIVYLCGLAAKANTCK